jgi:hypothetical protein
LYPKKDFSEMDSSLEIGKNATVHRHHFQMTPFKINMSSNSIIMRTENGDVVIYNPTQLDDKVQALISLPEGKDLYCIFPNKGHFKFFDDYLAEYPNVKVLVSSENTLEVAKGNVDEDSEYDQENIKVLTKELFNTLPWKKEVFFFFLTQKV